MKETMVILWVFIQLFITVNLDAQVPRSREGLLLKTTDEDYYYALIEATKQYVLGNYRESAALYIECLKYKPESAAVSFQLSQIFIKAGELDQALEFARQAYRNEEENKWYLINLVNLFQNNGETDSAIVMMEKLTMLEPFSIELKYMLSGLYEQRGFYTEALVCLEEIEEQVGISKEVLIAKYGILRQSGKNKEALEELRRAKIFFKDDYAVDGMMAEYFRDKQQYDSAGYYYERIVPDQLENLDVAVSYGEFLTETGKKDSAKTVLATVMSSDIIDIRTKESFFYELLQNETFFGKVAFMTDTLSFVLLKEYPDELGVQSIYADIQMRLGHYDKAAGMLKRIFMNDRTNYIAIEQLIYLENLMDRQDSIIHYAKIAVENFQTRPVPYLYLGSSFLQSKNYEEAVQYMEKGRRYVVGVNLQVQYFSLMAENYYRLMQYDSVWSCFEIALAADPENIIINNNYAYYLAEQNMLLEKAEGMSAYTVSREPKNPTYLDTYAWIMYQMGNLKQAKKYLEKAIKNDGSEDAEILDHYGDILYELGRFKDAVENWRKAMGYDASKSVMIIPKIRNAEQKIR